MLKLHIYGPAFGLPSIDAQCLAAIVLLRCCHDSTSWALIHNYDPSTTPFNNLPALYDETTWIYGFHDILKYLIDSNALPSSFSTDLSETQLADQAAYLSFLTSRGLPLLDLSLYVSSDNYTTCTRSIFGEILAWPSSWTVPQRLRDGAKKRSEHLGLSALDVDATREKELKQQNAVITAQIPQAPRRPTKQTVSALLGSKAEQTRFRLEAVTADFFSPLQHQMGQKGFLLGDEITAVDCLAIGILAQMQIDELPQPWLRNTLNDRYPRLASWTERNKERLFSDLPWRPASSRSWTAIASGILNMVSESLPITLVPVTVRTRSRDNTSKDVKTVVRRKQDLQLSYRSRQTLVREMIGSCISAAGIVGILVQYGILQWPSRASANGGRRDFGEAGAFFGLR